MSKNLYLVDAFALIYRAYYAFLRSPRINSKEINTSAIYGFVNTLLHVISTRKPDYLVVAFDMHAPTFRHQMYEQYKANREAQPEDIRISMPYIRRFLEAMNILTVGVEGFEADDIIGTLAKRFSGDCDKIYMLTHDKDYAQLVGSNVYMCRPNSNGSGFEDLDEKEVCSHFGISYPEQMIDLLALWGDSSDNIPGCPGIGEKRAKELLATYGSIDGIYENIDQIKGKVRENLSENRRMVDFSKELVTIRTDVPIDINIEQAKIVKPDRTKLQELFKELEFKSNLITRIDALSVGEVPLGNLFAQENTPNSAEIKDFSTVKKTYLTVESDDDFEKLREKIHSSTRFSFVTNQLGVAITVNAQEAFSMGINATSIEFLREIFGSDKLKIGQNIKADILTLSKYGVQIKSPMFDTSIAHFLLYPGLKHETTNIAGQLLNYQVEKPTTQEIADLTIQIYEVLTEKIDSDEQVRRLFYDVEMPLMPILAQMEIEGMRVDVDAINDYAKVLREDLENCEKHIKELAGVDFNLNSPKQVGEVLFDRLKLDENAKKTSAGQYVTNEETLQKLAHHEIVAEILKYRGILKLLSSYAEALPKMVDKENRIHSSFNQTLVITGRLSSSNPNLQNIPTRDEAGRRIREAFIASDGNILISADYSQVELRLMAHFSEDEHLINAFRHGEDIHAATAARIFGVDIADVSTDMRRKAKTANFGIIYGISAFGLSERLNIPRREAKEIIEGYFEKFPGIKNYIDTTIERAKKDGYVSTLLGRRRYLENINSRNSVIRSLDERYAINAPIQGTAADIIKIAMINIDRKIKETNLRSKMILQVHDELIFDAPTEEIVVLKDMVKYEMESAFELSVPLVVDIGEGKNWLEAH